MVDCSDIEKTLLGGNDFEKVKDHVVEVYGTKADDALDTNEKLEEYHDGHGDVNYYTCMALLILDPNQEFEHWRSQAKMFLLPAYQLFVPFGMCWYFLVQKDMWTDNGYCCNHSGFVFRFVGFVTFLYSAWQIIDGCDDSSSKFFLERATKYWSLTGRRHALDEAFGFYLCYLSQTLCSYLLLFVTLIIYTSQSDSPLDLLMNCVAINFVLDIDSEWMDDVKQDKAKESAKFLFKRWRDGVLENEEEVKTCMRSEKVLRKNAPKLVNGIIWMGDTGVAVLAYFFVIGWTFCPPQY